MKRLSEMSNAELRELKDLTQLAVDRTRKAVESVIQLMDSNALRGAVIATVAADMARGAAVLLEEAADISEREAQITVLYGMMHKLGIKADELKEAREFNVAPRQ
jgi:uncharacterized protein YoaH (UPF0181 family)